jgi:hypothetical protein
MISNKDLFIQSSNNILQESWAEFSRTLYIHKLVMPSLPDHTDDTISKLIDMDILKDKKEVYLYSFIHPDVNQVVSFVGPTIFKPHQSFIAWYAYVNPLRGMIYKGGQDSFSSESISKPQFETVSFLSTGEKVKFKKVAEIKTKAISTTIPLPGLVTIMYENMQFRCVENKYNINSVQFKKFKIWTMPQVFLKSNYVFTYKCIVK